jgi:hypothetical protein
MGAAVPSDHFATSTANTRIGGSPLAWDGSFDDKNPVRTGNNWRARYASPPIRTVLERRSPISIRRKIGECSVCPRFPPHVGGLKRQQVSSEGSYSTESLGVRASREIYAGLRVSSYKVALYRPPLLTNVVSRMTVPYCSVKDNQRTRLSTCNNFSWERSSRVG